MDTLSEQSNTWLPSWVEQDMPPNAGGLSAGQDGLESLPAWVNDDSEVADIPQPVPTEQDQNVPAWALEGQVADVEQKDIPAWAKSEVAPPEKLGQEPVSSFSVGDVAKGIAIESGGGIASNMAGAALAAALAPVSGGLSIAAYLGVSFVGGIISSIIAQKSTGNGQVSTGSALFSGVVNSIIPGGGAAATRGLATGAALTRQTLLQSAKREASRGTLFGVGDATARAVIDEGRMPTVSELTMSGGIGAVLGGGIGTVTPLAMRSYGKVAGKTAQEIDNSVSKGEFTGEDLINLTVPESKVSDNVRVGATAEVNGTGVSNDAANAMGALMDLNVLQRPGKLNEVTAEIAPSASVPREITEASRDFAHRVKAGAQLGAFITRKISSFYKNDPEMTNKVNRWIDTGVSDPALEPIMPDLIKFRDEQMRLSSELGQQIEEGAIARFTAEERVRFSQEVARSGVEGTYTRRQYKLFEDATFSPDPSLRSAAVQEIAAGLMREGHTHASATKGAEQHLNNLIMQGAKAKATQGKNAGTGTLSPLKARTNPGPAERAYLGEITDPSSRITGTLEGLTRLVEQNKANSIIRDTLRKYGLVSDSLSDVNNAQLTLRGENFLGDYVSDGTLRAVQKLYGNKTFSTSSDNLLKDVARDVWGVFNVAAKASKVILNPPTYAVNFLSSISMIATQGINMASPKNALRFWEGLKIAASDLQQVEKLTSRTEAQRRLLLNIKHDMDQHGITNGTVVVEDAKRSAQMGKVASRMFDKLVKPFGAAYSSFDTAARYVAWQNNMDVVRRITGIADESAVKRLAAEITNNQYPNYNFLSDHIRAGSGVGVLSPFVAFIAELNRNIFQQVKSARQMIDGTYFARRGIELTAEQLQDLAREGTKRAASLVAVGAGAAAGLWAINRSLGTTAEQERAMRDTLVPEWDKNKSLFLMKSKDGKSLSYMNASYVIPHLSMTKAVEAAFLDLDPMAAAELIADEFGGEGTLAARAIFRGIFNQDARGNPISRSDDFLESAGERTAFVVNEALTPGAFREADRLVKASRGQGGLSVGEVAARQLGYRVNKIDIADTAVFTIRKDLENARAFRSAYTRARDYQGVAAGQLAAIYQEQNRNYRKSYEAMIRHNRNLATLGMDEKARIDVMKRAGLSSRDILNVLDGKVNDLPMVKTVAVSDTYASLPADRKERLRAINEIARSNAKLGMDLLRMEKREQKNSRTGITSRESLIKNLSVAERASMILDSEDPRSTLREWQRKGLASTSVAREVQDRLRSQPIAR